jgi:hypothetical protein
LGQDWLPIGFGLESSKPRQLAVINKLSVSTKVGQVYMGEDVGPEETKVRD